MIEVQDVSKSFFLAEAKQGAFASLKALFSRAQKEVKAVDYISFSIREGDFVGYIGPNGAGKSTMIKMLAGILHPTQGRIFVCGHSPHAERKKVARQIGVVFGQRTQLWWDLPVRDSFEILQAMYNIDDTSYRRSLETFFDLLSLHEFFDTPVRKLSLGQRMRADLGAALLHDPPVLFLDEPTIGLDVMAKTKIRSFLKEINESRKKTILLTTHDMDDIEQLCGRVIIINGGKKVIDTTMQNLRRQIRLPSMIQVDYLDAPQLPGEIAGVERLEVRDNQLTLYFDKQQTKSPQLLQEVAKWGEPVDIRMKEPGIEELIKRLYG